jgi:glycerophosphoryl diester phosphodiesterase
MIWARRKQFRIHVWTVNEPAEAQRLVRPGVHGLITNKPKYIKENISTENTAGVINAID